MQEEMDSLHRNHTYELVKLPKGKKILKNKWVYRIKQEEHTPHPRYNARLVVRPVDEGERAERRHRGPKIVGPPSRENPLLSMPPVR